MCGIAGIFDYSHSPKPIAIDHGIRMIDALIHRGPDDGGIVAAGRVLLAHRRLSILDLTPDAQQPMRDPTGQFWMVYNGEIYNYRELKEELQQLGCHFRSRSDSEVVLYAYRQWGPDCVQRLNGMFAVAIWDASHQRLWLARDHAGIKPLFYRLEGQRLSFASEIKGLLAEPGARAAPDADAIDHLLTFGYVAAPETGFRGIRQLMPGCQMLVEPGQLRESNWYHLPYPERPSPWSARESVDRLEQAIQAAIQRQLISDVPLGAFLSGGLDSTAVVRGMSRLGRRDEQLKTFTIGMEAASFDESQYAQLVADRYQTRHHIESIPPCAPEMLIRMVAQVEEPVADNSILPVWLLCESARKHVTVALSGDGMDELLAGYDTYRASRMAAHFRRMPVWLRQHMIQPCMRAIPVSDKKYNWPALMRRFVGGASLPFPYDHASWRRMVDASWRLRLCSEDFLRERKVDPLQAYAQALDDIPDWLTPLEKQLHMDFRFHLPNDMLVKVDRASMAHSLEVRVPLLDREVIATCLSIPQEHKLRGKQGKWPLRQLLARDFPAQFIHRRKAGFVLPIENWLRGPWRDLTHQFLTPEWCSEVGWLNSHALQTMIQQHMSRASDHGYALMTLLVFSLWWRLWIAGSLERPRTHSPVLQSASPTRIMDSTNLSPA